MRKAAKKREKRSKTEISGDFGSWGGRDALKFKIDASGGSDYNQRRQKKIEAVLKCSLDI